MDTSPPGAEVSSLKHNFIKRHDIVQRTSGSVSRWMQLDSLEGCLQGDGQGEGLEQVTQLMCPQRHCSQKGLATLQPDSQEWEHREMCCGERRDIAVTEA